MTLKKKTPAKKASQDAAVAQAKRTGGQIDVQKKHQAGTNKQHGGPVVDARKLEDEDAEVKLKSISADLKIQIQQGRQAKVGKTKQNK